MSKLQKYYKTIMFVRKQEKLISITSTYNKYNVGTKKIDK